MNPRIFKNKGKQQYCRYNNRLCYPLPGGHIQKASKKNKPIMERGIPQLDIWIQQMPTAGLHHAEKQKRIKWILPATGGASAKRGREDNTHMVWLDLNKSLGRITGQLPSQGNRTPTFCTFATAPGRDKIALAELIQHRHVGVCGGSEEVGGIQRCG